MGHQVRIERKDDPRFFALYTVKLANPPEDVSDPSRVNVVRTGQAWRERLGTTVEMKAVVHATVVDTAPPPSGARFFEMAEKNGRQTYLIAVAPHGGAIEERTDEEAEIVKRELVSSCFLHPRGSAKDMGTTSRKHLTAGTSRPPICIQLVFR